MNKILISLGSNMPSGEKNMKIAIEKIRAKATYARFSSLYDTDPIGIHQHARYKNSVAQIHSSESFESWQSFFKKLEADMGRDETTRLQGNVPLDIDIVIWNDEVLRPKDLAAEYLQVGLQEIANE